MKILGKVLLSAMLAGSLTVMASDDAKMDKFIDDLMSKMTLEEKLGQINLPPGSDIVTGDPQSSDIGSRRIMGSVGSRDNGKDCSNRSIGSGHKLDFQPYGRHSA